MSGDRDMRGDSARRAERGPERGTADAADREVRTTAAREPDREAQARAAADRLRRFGGQELARDMIQMFVEDTPQRIATARDGVAHGDAGTVEHAAHSTARTA
jgi:HPt (histidine-containing phosphotransfer) domain-containing protein